MAIRETAQTYDLLKLRNRLTALSAVNQLKAGHYTQIGLKMTDGSNVITDGTRYNLEIPSRYQSEGKINRQFVVQEDVRYGILPDFDAEKSMAEKGSGQFRWSRRPADRQGNFWLYLADRRFKERRSLCTRGLGYRNLYSFGY